MNNFTEKIYDCNTVIGFEGDKAIIKQDDGLLFYAEYPAGLIDIGETVDPDELISLSELPLDERNRITAKYADVEV